MATAHGRGRVRCRGREVEREFVLRDNEGNIHAIGIVGGGVILVRPQRIVTQHKTALFAALQDAIAKINPGGGGQSRRIEGMACVNALLGSKAATIAKELRTIKRLETWLTQHGEDGKKITGPLVGINDLRQGDAHAGDSTAKSALAIFGISDEADDYQRMNLCILESISSATGWIAKMLDEKGPLP